jgi:hypothetical protein
MRPSYRLGIAGRAGRRLHSFGGAEAFMPVSAGELEQEGSK